MLPARSDGHVCTTTLTSHIATNRHDIPPTIYFEGGNRNSIKIFLNHPFKINILNRASFWINQALSLFLLFSSFLGIIFIVTFCGFISNEILLRTGWKANIYHEVVKQLLKSFNI